MHFLLFFTQIIWDWIFNWQIYSAAALSQVVVKWFTPFGWIWSPILSDIALLVSWPQSNTLEKASYYHVTTNFVKALKAGYGGTNFDFIRLTGHSLGGGLAMISAAQTHEFAVSLSGPVAMISRKTLSPPITVSSLQNEVFNIMPDRDPVPRIGGRAPLSQQIECLADTNEIGMCHLVGRSVCEIVFRCGSHGRPIPCMCYETYGYPKPDPIPGKNNGRSFEEACAAENANWIGKESSGLAAAPDSSKVAPSAEVAPPAEESITYPACNICGENGRVVGNPNEAFSTVNVYYRDGATCGELQAQGELGLLKESSCTMIQNFLALPGGLSACNCIDPPAAAPVTG